MSPTIPQVELNNGTKIPLIGAGAAPSPFAAEGCDPAKKWILTAIQAGYRHIDTAQVYGTEKVVGEAIRESGIPREEFFITTKLPFTCQDRVAESFDLSLKNLGLDYVDLYLMHQPMTIPYQQGKSGRPPSILGLIITSLQDTWMAFPLGPDGSMVTLDSPTFNESYAEIEKIYASGRAKAIGVSNFSIKTLEELLQTATVVPAVNQVERHPYIAQNDLIAYHKTKGIATEAYSPGGNKNAIREDPVINEIAAKHGVSPTQVILAWNIVGDIIILPKSVNEQRQKDNINLPTLDEEDLKRIDGLDHGERLCNPLDKNGKIWGWTKERMGW